MRYEDLILEAMDAKLKKTADKRRWGWFKVRVVQSPAGYMSKSVPVKYDDTALQITLGKLERRELLEEDLIALGKDLASWLLPARRRGQDRGVRDYLIDSLSSIGPDAGLRLRLRLHRQLHALPWEYMYLEGRGPDRGRLGFLSLDQRVVIIRHEEEGAPEQPVPIEGDLKVLAAMASREGLSPLELDKERTVLGKALRRRVGIKPEFLENAEGAEPKRC
jgi:hypothetical protein